MLKTFAYGMPLRIPGVVLAAVIAWFISAPPALQAGTVELPLFLRLQILQNGLEQSLKVEPDGKAVLYQNDPYNYLHITQPVLSIDKGETHFTCKAAAGVGFGPVGVLPTGLEWAGSIDLQLLFYVDQEWQLRYRITGSAIYDEDGSKALVTSFVWHLAKRYLYPALEDFAFNLAVPQQEIIALLRTCGSPDDTGAFAETLRTVQAGTLRVEVDGVTVPLLLNVADQPPGEVIVAAVQKPLTGEELEEFQKVFEPLDAFLVFVVKTTGSDFVSPGQREQLFELLINSRYELLSILAGETAVDAEDPLRILFVNAWQQLRSIVESSEGEGRLMQEQLLRYMTFINAGDALLVLDAAAPQIGMRITTDGLRQLARMLQPDSVEDPLRYDWQVDPGLRNLFNFLPEPAPEEPATLGRLLLDLLFVGSVHAAETDSSVTADPARRLDRWVPAPHELADYTALVSQLLKTAAYDQVKQAGLENPFTEIFQHLVPATALMESCWRQYLREGDRIMFLRSRSGSIGMMQINQHVWRGFFSIERLKWDAAYNVQAGTQILMLYFTDYGVKVAQKSGRPEYAARSAYSAYNAGPQAARRFMSKNATTREKQVDGRLWSHFQGISAGGKVNPATCTVDRETS